MTRKGNCQDDSAWERFFPNLNLKMERVCQRDESAFDQPINESEIT